MNPLHWKREHQIALLGATIVGACIGIFAGARQLEPSANYYWLWLGLWGAGGAVTGAAGGFIRQLYRNLNHTSRAEARGADWRTR